MSEYSHVVEVTTEPEQIVEITRTEQVVEIAAEGLQGPPGPAGVANLVTFETGNEPDPTTHPDGTLWVEYI